MKKLVKVIAGKFEKAKGPEKNHNVEPIYLHVNLKENKEFKYNVPSGHNSFIYLFKGVKGWKKDHNKTLTKFNFLSEVKIFI